MANPRILGTQQIISNYFAPKQGTIPIFAHTFLTFLGYYLLISREVSLVCLSVGSTIVCLADTNVSPVVRQSLQHKLLIAYMSVTHQRAIQHQLQATGIKYCLVQSSHLAHNWSI